MKIELELTAEQKEAITLTDLRELKGFLGGDTWEGSEDEITKDLEAIRRVIELYETP